MGGALFLLALATVMFEVLLTRVFSVTLWYHFAFLAISIAMFGMSVGALLVFLRPQAWPQEKLSQEMGKSALLLALTMAAAVLLHVYVFVPHPYALPVLWTFVTTAVPFLFSGIFVSLALTRFPSRVGQLYALDLSGAAIGCLAVFAALRWLDGIGAVLACAGIAAASGALLARGTMRTAALLTTGLLAALALWSALHLSRDQVAALPIPYVKGERQLPYDYERWNSFSRIVVTPPDDTNTNATAWSLSAAYKAPLTVPKRWLQIDAGAGTQLLRFDGDLQKLDFLRWDLTNFVHYLRRGANVCIVGSGGGRDVLAAKLFGQKRVTAVEINPNILQVANGRFGDFTGHLDREPGVTFVNDEARSYFARTPARCDILQLTFIDTWAATAAGAFALTENTLYTVDAWKIFLSRLSDDGVLAVARGDTPELARLVALGRQALTESGVAEPRRHMILVVNNRAAPPRSVGPMGLLLVGKTPFTEQETEQVHRLALGLQFNVALDPHGSPSQLLRAMATGRGVSAATAPSGLNYDPPTDEQPFFFNMERISTATLTERGETPVGLLMWLLIGVLALTLVCIVLPLVLRGTALVRGDGVLLAFFAAIGAGFMLVEISMLQRLTVFLGHPTYSLTVILFVLLLASGLGSRLSARVPDAALFHRGTPLLAALTTVLGVAGAATVHVLLAFQASTTPLRIAVAAAVLAVIGVFMGTAFPIGMRVAVRSRPELGPWLWGINGATSVLASVLAVVIATAFGISVSFWSGVASYSVALITFAWAARRASGG